MTYQCQRIDRPAQPALVIRQWTTANGYTPSGVAYEFYLNDPQSTPADELRTQVMFPLK
jgi:effector-binding domain-containing protein